MMRRGLYMLDNNESYITISGDTWDMISYKVYGDCNYIDRLIKNNIRYAEIVVFPSGIEILVPQIETTAADTLPPWKR